MEGCWNESEAISLIFKVSSFKRARRPLLVADFPVSLLISSRPPTRSMPFLLSTMLQPGLLSITPLRRSSKVSFPLLHAFSSPELTLSSSFSSTSRLPPSLSISSTYSLLAHRDAQVRQVVGRPRQSQARRTQLRGRRAKGVGEEIGCLDRRRVSQPHQEAAFFLRWFVPLLLPNQLRDEFAITDFRLSLSAHRKVPR